VSIRSKETQYDYRFMPEPNLLPLVVYPSASFSPQKSSDQLNTVKCTNNPELLINDDLLKKLKSKDLQSFVDLDKTKAELRSKTLPQNRRSFLIENFDLDQETSFTFVAHNLDNLLIEIVNQFQVEKSDIKLYTRVLLTNYLHLINRNLKMDKIDLNLRCKKIYSYVVEVVKNKRITKRIAVDFFVDLFNQDLNLEKLAMDLIKEKNLFVIDNEAKIQDVILSLFKENQKALNEYKSKEKKREKIFDFFVGRVHKKFNELADSELVERLVRENLQKTLPRV
jgi:Asp-tRNA(Asn)/Glu-tRNA(Gln) amidotransferase B subunit